jgi:hypothetical protein
MGFSEARDFFEDALKAPLETLTPVAISPAEYCDLMWVWNDVFRPKAAMLASMPYGDAFEDEADRAICALIDAPPEIGWIGCSPGCWRVLVERHSQMLAVATANLAAGIERLTYLPLGLSRGQQRVALALLFLLQMKLPLPPDGELAVGSLRSPEPASFSRH